MNEEQKPQYDQMVAQIPVGVYRFRTSPDGKMTFEYVNRQFCQMLATTSEALYGDAQIAFDLVHPEDREDFVHQNEEVMKTHQPFSWEGRVIIDGEIKWFRISSIPEVLECGDIIWNGVQIDITERKEVEKALRDANTLLENRLAEIEKLQSQLREHATRDYLTDLYNRRYLDETIERELARANREARKLSVVMMDIDQFKGVNDIFGHQAGDEVLMALGTLLKEKSRSSDIACRYGGDEFVVVMLNASVDDAYRRAQEWLNAFAKKRFVVGAKTFATTLSMGIAAYPLHGSSPLGIFQAADEALYHSKKYRNTVTISRRTATGMLRSID